MTKKGKYIEELTPGEFPSSVFRLDKISVNPGDRGPKLTLTLSDRTDTRKAKIWKATSQEIASLQSANFVCVSGRVDGAGPYEGELTLEEAEVVELAHVDSADFIPDLPANHSEHKKQFTVLIRTLSGPLYELARIVFETPVREKYYRAVAAKEMHHGYPGGLLEHSVEVATFCQQMARMAPELQRDLLVFCALVHDIGKLDEMEHELLYGTYTEAGTLVGHTVLGAHRVAACADRIENFPLALKHSITHMILSHHGTLEFGAARLPACPEAVVLAQCDLLSARLQQFKGLRAKSAPGAYSAYAPSFEAKYAYVGDYGLGASGAENTAPTPRALTGDWLGLSSTSTFTTLPILGVVAAGDPGCSSGEAEESRDVVLPQGGADYLLRVTGESMTGAGIMPGDLVYVKRQHSANNGDIVVALITGEGELVKRFRGPSQGDSNGDAYLDSENSAYEPIRMSADTVIQGKVTGLLRDI